MRPRPGVFLVASPHLSDANFVRSVVYLLDHGDTGSLGFILNRPLDVPLGELWNDAPPGLSDARIAAEGGPVDKHKGLLLHGDTTLAGAQLMSEGIAVGGDPDALQERWGTGGDHCGPRLFLGHSGWTSGQLDREIEEGAWLVRPGRIDLLFDPRPAELLWQHLVEGRNGGMPDPSRN
ncbi:MAG: YqgE/AlgH family protein [Planctomycetes bacterium]|nr:YqgE/AlgH family protein [Planctomycetota bacterium]